MKQVLTIAGSDSGGGAGIQADLKTIHANGAFGMSVITSVTAQNTMEIRRAFDLPVDLIVDQIETVFDDFDVAAVKTGMLSSRSIVEGVANQLSKRRVHNLVVDPVMISTSGFVLLESDAVQSLEECLLPLAAVVTPNISEAQRMAGMEIKSIDQAVTAAQKILKLGPQAVLIKGGHLEVDSRSVDILFDDDGEMIFEAERINRSNTLGTGCTFSAAIAASLAAGKPLREAVGNAKTYVTNAIQNALSIGQGFGPAHHFYFLGGER